jgi:hypothetical protein
VNGWLARESNRKPKKPLPVRPGSIYSLFPKFWGQRPTGTPKAPQTKPAKPGKPKSERAQRREWRGNVVDYLIDCLTDPACELLNGQWFESHRIGSMWLGFYDKLDQIERTVDDKPDVLTDPRLSIAIEALRRLSGETPAG